MSEERLPTAADLIQSPDTYREYYQDQLRQSLVNANGARIMLRKIDSLCREAEELEVYRSNGFPAPRPHRRREPSEPETEVSEPVPVTRKPQVLALVSQDRNRQWSVRQIGEALDIDNLKSLRVTLEEMARAGTLFKTPDARYKAAGEPQDM
jgi:hypothetical protein